MDDIFDGWLAMPSVAAFLVDDASMRGSKQPGLAAHTEQYHPSPSQDTQPPTSNLNGHDPLLTVSGDSTVAPPRDSRQRRGHTKSRLGCITCKKRKIKYPYLMEAILALAGSHLAVQVETPKNNLALQHRQKAIVGLEEAFARWPPSADEAHVMLATSYMLSFQSSYMEDGFLEHFISLRGCSLLSQLILSEGFGGPFAVQADVQATVINSMFSNFPELDQELACEALLSLKGFAHLLEGPNAHSIEKALVVQFVETIRCLLHGDAASECETVVTPDLSEGTTVSQTSSPCTRPRGSSTGLAFMNPLLPAGLDSTFDQIEWTAITTPPSPTPSPIQSFKALMLTLTILTTWPHDALIHVFEPTNQLGNIVMAHFCAIRFIISPLSATIHVRTPVKAVVDWMAKIIAAIDEDENKGWVAYVEWPRKILRCMQACIEKKRELTLADIRDILIHDPAAFKEGRVQRC
ncbi:hypothetical protein EJ02DRAFT_504003 [Clathrospora elynae]|uniref:Transcription factor domain-containing protein n=1 Tax=Clathrospora elynae TaxID=706981 RepID=A0A6A5SMI2_9PLEO|nr:hypothetical protein EJ02DRAFT_504003 [Clathrospora elynae]